MTDDPIPSTGALVEVTTAAQQPLGGVRVVAADATVLTLSLATAQVPAEGETVTLRWPAGARGRYVLDATVVAVDENRFDVLPARRASIEQQRSFVRGGGGEHVLLRRPGQPDALGWIRDISEQGVRAHFADVDVSPGDDVRLHVQLESEVIEVAAVAAKVGSLRQTVPQHGPMSVELVAVLSCDETQAQLIRRYVLRQQLLTRARTG
jgi:hypothetical protein